MDWVIIAGALSLGVILGWMGYIVFVSQSNIKTLIAIVGLFGGAVVVGIFQAIAGTKAALPREVWFYPVGLLAGIAFAAAIAAITSVVTSLVYGFYLTREQVKNLIVAHIKNKLDGDQHITMIASDTLRTDLGLPGLTDAFVDEIVLHYPNELCHRTLPLNRRGVGLVDEQIR